MTLLPHSSASKVTTGRLSHTQSPDVYILKKKTSLPPPSSFLSASPNLTVCTRVRSLSPAHITPVFLMLGEKSTRGLGVEG